MVHKQFTLDRVAKQVGVVNRGNDQAQTPNITVSNFNWQFHKFVVKGRGKEPKGKIIARSADLDLVKKKFKKKPKAAK